MAFGKEIKRLRKASGVTSGWLANLIGIDHDKFRKWEQRDANPKYEDRQEIEAFFGIGLEDIMELDKIPGYLIVRQKEGNKRELLYSWFLSLDDDERKRFLESLNTRHSENDDKLLGIWLSSPDETDKKQLIEYHYLSLNRAEKSKVLEPFEIALNEKQKNSKGGYDATDGIKNKTQLPIEKIPFYESEILNSQPPVLVDPGYWLRVATGAMLVHGNNMAPKYLDGCIVAFVEMLDKKLIIFGQDYVVETSEYRILKRLQKRTRSKHVIAESYNEETNQAGKLIHEPFEIPLDKIIRLYRVVGKVERNESGNRNDKIINPLKHTIIETD